MAFTTTCTSKGCFKLQEPYIDPKTKKVYCSLCDSEITNITNIAKHQLIQNKQFRKKKTKPFSVKCENCDNEDKPILSSDKTEVLCNKCKKPIKSISDIFKKMLIDNLLKSEDK